MSNKMQKRDITKLIVTSLAILTISSIIFFVTHDKINTNTAIAQPMTSRAYPFGNHIYLNPIHQIGKEESIPLDQISMMSSEN
jgi:glucose uptake protein GlcU